MKPTLQLQIPEPCHEDWNKMTVSQQGRFCMSCRKEVVDFSVMDDVEILQYLSKGSADICGRVQDDQLNRVIQAPVLRRQHSFKYFWRVMIASFLISNESSAQLKNKIRNIIAAPGSRQTKGEIVPKMVGGILPVIIPAAPEWEIGGRVLDEYNNPVSYASVTIKGTETGMATDANGIFLIKTSNEKQHIDVAVSAAGYVLQTIGFDKPLQSGSSLNQNNIFKMDLGDISLKTTVMDSVVITGYGRTTGKVEITTGAIMVSRTDTLFNREINKFNEWVGKNEISIYPNPVGVNRPFTLRIKVKQTGDYLLQFMDASGRVISSRPVKISSKDYIENLNGNIFPAHGVYFLGLTARQGGKYHSAKIMVQ